MEEYYLNTIQRKLSITYYSTLKLIVVILLISFNLISFGQSYVIGEPRGVLNKLLMHYKQVEKIGDSIIIDVEIKQTGDTTIFCIGKFKDASDIFIWFPSTIYRKDGNYIFVKTGAEKYFSYSEAYIKFIYSLATKFTRLDLKVKSYSPFVTESTDEFTIVGGDTSDYTWYWYYVVNYGIIKIKKMDTGFYSVYIPSYE